MIEYKGYKIDSELGHIYNTRGKRVPDGNAPYVRVYSDGRQMPGHRFLWEAVNGPIPKGIEINHINGIKKDNRIVNLELVTRSGNEIHSRHVLGNLCKPIMAINVDSGESTYFASIRAACNELNLFQPLITMCLKGKRRKHGRYRFEFTERRSA